MNKNIKSLFLITGSLFFVAFLINQLYYYYAMSQLSDQMGKTNRTVSTYAKEISGSPKKLLKNDLNLTDIHHDTSSAELSEFFIKNNSLDTLKPETKKQSNDLLIKTQKQVEALETQIAMLDHKYTTLVDSTNNCATKTEFINRLDCYDAILHKKEHFGDKHKNWKIERHISPITDVFTIKLAVNADQSFRNKRGKVFNPVFSVSCSAKRSTVQLNAGFFLAYRQHYIVTRIGKNNPEGSFWRITNSGESARYEHNVPNLIKQLINTQHVVLQYGEANDLSTVLTFDATGIINKRDEILEACGIV